jgi:hypothetical protein
MTDFMTVLPEEQIPNIANKRAGEYFRVEVSFPLSLWVSRSPVETRLNSLAKEFGGRNTGSGAGFGSRDMTMEFYTHIEALAFIDVASKIPHVIVDSLSFNSEHGFGYLPI